MTRYNYSLPVSSGLINRPKVDALLKEAVKKPLVTVIAGVGYGKTQAVASHIEKHYDRTLYMRMTAVDNIPAHFWEDFVNAMNITNSELAASFDSIGFPENLSQFDKFIRTFVQDIYTREQCVIIIDDYHNIYERKINRFIENLVEANIENLSIILISNSKVDFNLLSMMDNNLIFQISTEDLRFTKEEVKEILEIRDMKFSNDALNELYYYVDGWPLAVAFFADKYEGKEISNIEAIGYALPDLSNMFERLCFKDYDDSLQQILIKLSLLDTFSIEIVKEITDRYDFSHALKGSLVNIEVISQHLSSNMFINYNPITRLYAFQNLFKEFLNQKQVCLSEKDKHEVYVLAAKWFDHSDRKIEAITYYEKCNMYEEVFQTILRFPQERMSKELGDFTIKYLDLLPEEFKAKNPLSRSFKANVLFSNFEIDKAKETIYTLIKELEAKENDPESRRLLGEMNIILSDMAFVDNTDKMFYYYKKAYEYIPEGSIMRGSGMLLFRNNSEFFLERDQPGEIERLRNLFFEHMPFASDIMNGCGHGYEYLFSAEGAYFSYDFERSFQDAYKAIYRSKEKNQYDIAANAYFLLTKLHLYSGEYKKAKEQLAELVKYINENNLTILYELRDCAEGWFYSLLNDFEKVPWWIIYENHYLDSRAPMDLGRENMLRAYFFLHSKRYYELLAMLEQMEAFYKKRGLWGALLYTKVMRSVCYMKNGDNEKAVESFKDAYDMTYTNNIVTPFIGFGSNMRTLIEVVKRSQSHTFDDNWLHNVQQKSSTFAKRISAMKAEHAKEDKSISQEKKISLTDREYEVLKCLAQGLTREEIGDFYHISVSTVKTIITNIYNKLGAINRADAVHIATVLGLIR